MSCSNKVRKCFTNLKNLKKKKFESIKKEISKSKLKEKKKQTC